MADRNLIDVAHVSAKGTSYSIAIPRKIVKSLKLEDECIIAFYSQNEKVFIEKVDK